MGVVVVVVVVGDRGSNLRHIFGSSLVFGGVGFEMKRGNGS